MKELNWGKHGEKLSVELEEGKKPSSKNIRLSLEGYMNQEINALLTRAQQYDRTVKYRDGGFLKHDSEKLCVRLEKNKGKGTVDRTSRILLLSEIHNCASAFELATGLAELIGVYKKLVNEIGTDADVSYFSDISMTLYDVCFDVIRELYPERPRHRRGYGQLPGWFLPFLEEVD